MGRRPHHGNARGILAVDPDLGNPKPRIIVDSLLRSIQDGNPRWHPDTQIEIQTYDRDVLTLQVPDQLCRNERTLPSLWRNAEII
jgi:hypothetical protein